MPHIDQTYHTLAKTVLSDGFRYLDESRNIGMVQIPHYTFRHEMADGFPLISTKKIYWKTVLHELIWMLSGSTNIDYLLANNVNIWTKDAQNFSGGSYVGRIYGAQWRSWTHQKSSLDQIATLIDSVRYGGLFNRRQIVTAWNPAELDNMALPPCHWAFEVFPVMGPHENDLADHGFGIKWHQRSCDTFLGIPFDIASYAFLGRIIEHFTDIPFKLLIGDLTNVHFYEPHIPLIHVQLGRESTCQKAGVELADPFFTLDDIQVTDFKVTNYEPHPPIKAELYTKKK